MILRRARPLLGTFVEITAEGSEAPALNEAIQRAFSTIEKVDRLMSYHKPDSDVSMLNRRAWHGEVQVDPWTYEVLKAAAGLELITDGLFNINVAHSLISRQLLPKDENGTELEAQPEQACARKSFELHPGCRIKFSRPDVRIDLGGIAKGFAVDRACDALRESGVASGLVNAGGDLCAFGARAYPVAIRHPMAPGLECLRLELKEASLASSGNYFLPDVAITNPATGGRCRGVLAATVRAASCLLADAGTKAIFAGRVRGLECLKKIGACGLLIHPDLTMEGDLISALLNAEMTS